MRRWRFRLGLRPFMALVAVAALTMGGGLELARLARLRAEYCAELVYHEQREVREQRNLDVIARLRAQGKPIDGTTARIEEQAMVRVHYHGALKRKYQRAASHPWEPVAPDPKDPGEALTWELLKAEPIDPSSLPPLIDPACLRPASAN